MIKIGLVGFSISLLILFSLQEEPLRMNDMKVLGSHNSYKLHIDPALQTLLNEQSPGSIDGLLYSHVSLTEQLNLGLRKLELDVVYDPEGGMYATPFGHTGLKNMGAEVSEFDPDSVMRNPGFKVLHVPDVDFRTNCYTFKRCLVEVKNWSLENPNHLPIAIMMNAKDGGVGQEGFVVPLQFDSVAFDAWDQEILDIFDRGQLLLPEDVKGNYATLEEAVLTKGWPTLEDSRGKVYFILDHSDQKMQTYIKHHPSLQGRVMFVNAPAGTPEAAFMVINDPVKDKEYIQKMVKMGYLVRTRSDANTTEARENDYSRFEAALESGAQIISTDYYLPDTLFGNAFHITLDMHPEEN